MAIGSIIIDANPILKWEQYHLNLDRKYIVRPVPEYRDVGGNWKLTFGIHPDRVTRALSDDLLVNGAMRRVRLFNDKGILEWGGFIARVVEDTGTVKTELNIANVFNRQWARYKDGATTQRSTKYNDTDSQDRIGIKERVIIAVDVSPATADQHIQQLMTWTSFPSPSIRQIDFGGTVKSVPSLRITALGWWHTLGSRVYNQTASSGDQDASVIVTAIISDVGQFIVSTDIQDNVTQLEQKFDTDRKANQIIQSIASVGDSGFHKWIAGADADAEFYYNQAARPER